MRPIRAAALVVGLFILAGIVSADDKKALKELEGTYLMIGLEAKGLKISEDDLKKFAKEEERKIIIKGDQIIAKGKDKDDPATIKIDTSKKPYQIDITSTKDGKKEVNYGIYKYEDGVLTICATEKGEPADRPTKFEPGEKGIMIILKRQK